MTTQSPAALALIEALKNPALDPAARLALVAALDAVATPAASVQAPTTEPTRKAATSRDAATRQPVLRGERVSLTKSYVASLPLPEAGERLVYDTQTPQLAVRLRPGGRTYIVQLWDRERRRRTSRTLGKCSALTPEQARNKAQQLVARVADGEDLRREKNEGLTLRELIGMWHAEKSNATRTADELRDKALDYLGDLADQPASEIEREDIGRIHHEIATTGQRRVYKRVDGELRRVPVGTPGLPATADKWRAVLTAIYNWAESKGLVSSNPAQGIALAFDAKRAARTNYLRGDSLLAFWKHMEADPDADVRDALKLMLFTGQRRGNVMAMRWADVDLAAGVWTLGAHQTKQARAQTTPLVAQACEVLQRRYESAATPWVFPAVRVVNEDGELGHMADTRLRDAWERICTAAGIKDLRPHDLRHTSGSWLARLGASEAVRQKALGHQTPAMAARYSHLELDPVADALQRVADAVEAEATKPVAAVRSFKARAKS